MRKLLVVVALLFSTSAFARHGGIYLELAPGWGFYSSDEVIIEKDVEGHSSDGDTIFSPVPPGGFTPTLKAGFNLFGWAGAEAQVGGFWWDLGGSPGGAGFAGGVVRVTPLEVLSYILPDDVQVPSLVPMGPVKWKDRPFDLGISIGGGYAIAGEYEDYVYQGSYFQWGFDAKFYVTPNFTVGLDFPFRTPLYDPFRYANFNNHTGYCTLGKQAFVPAGGGKIFVPDSAGDSFAIAAGSDVKATCPGAKAPSAFFFAPAVTIGGVFDLGI